MDNKKMEQAHRCQELREKYYKLHESGAGLYISATPDEVASLCVREDLPYMPDYIYDENGTLIQIMFDRIERQ